MGCIQLDILEKSFSKFEVIRKNSVASKTRIVNFPKHKKGVEDYYPFGMQMPGRSSNSSDYRYGYQGSEKDNEVKGNGNSYTTHFRQLDPRLGRWLSIDSETASLPWQSPYVSMDNNPILLNDPMGDKTDDWVQVDGQMKYDSRVEDQADAVALYGENAKYRDVGYSYTASNGHVAELGDYGFFKDNGEIKNSPDLAKESLAFTNPDLALSEANKSISVVEASFPIVMGIRTFQIADVVTPEPSDFFPPKWIGQGVLFLGTAYYVYKMEAEIEGILRRAGGAQGYMYSLNANTSGDYPVMSWGSKFPTSTTSMNALDVWKYGETTTKRYSDPELKGIGDGGVTKIDLIHGNQVQIKVAEKAFIYSYFLSKGHLPPGNKIFR